MSGGGICHGNLSGFSAGFMLSSIIVIPWCGATVLLVEDSPLWVEYLIITGGIFDIEKEGRDAVYAVRECRKGHMRF